MTCPRDSFMDDTGASSSCMPQLCNQTHYFCLYTPHTTHTHPFYDPLDFVQDYPGEQVPEPIWILLKQETVSGSGISWAICKSAPRPRKITTTAPHHSVYYRPDALLAVQPTASKHWRPAAYIHINKYKYCLFQPFALKTSRGWICMTAVVGTLKHRIWQQLDTDDMQFGFTKPLTPFLL